MIVFLRVMRIRGLFESGEEIEATVKKVSRSRGGTTLKLEYRRAGTTHEIPSSIQRGSRIPTFTSGTQISLLVDPLRPRRAVPVALYASPDPPRGESP